MRVGIRVGMRPTETVPDRALWSCVWRSTKRYQASRRQMAYLGDSSTQRLTDWYKRGRFYVWYHRTQPQYRASPSAGVGV
eukprot:3071534-Rhodomonas_salina.1